MDFFFLICFSSFFIFFPILNVLNREKGRERKKKKKEPHKQSLAWRVSSLGCTPWEQSGAVYNPVSAGGEPRQGHGAGSGYGSGRAALTCAG